MATRTRKGGNAKAKAPKVDAYQAVTDRIVEALEAGVVPWHRPWKSYSDGPRSLTTMKPYRGINVFILGATSMINGYTSQWWGTYKQIGERGGQVRKGEKATPIVFWTFFGEKRNEQGGIVERGIPVLRRYSVFNADQCDDLTVPETEEIPETDPHDEAERIVGEYLTERGGPKLQHGGNDAYYNMLIDEVVMPERGQFETVDHYYGALFHEMAHSTGVAKRLNRKDFTSGRFGDEAYAKEELVAEMAAAFLTGEAGLDVHVDVRAGYIASWLRALKNDNKLVVQAGGAAQKAADHILGRTDAPEATTNEEG